MLFISLGSCLDSGLCLLLSTYSKSYIGVYCIQCLYLFVVGAAKNRVSTRYPVCNDRLMLATLLLVLGL